MRRGLSLLIWGPSVSGSGYCWPGWILLWWWWWWWWLGSSQGHAWTTPWTPIVSRPPQSREPYRLPLRIAAAQVDSDSEYDISNSPTYDRFAAFLAKEIGLTDPTKVKKSAERNPSAVSYSEQAIKERLDVLRDVLNFNNEELQKLIQSKVLNRAPKTLRTKMEQLSQILSFDNDMKHFVSILQKHPQILGLDMEKNLAPKIKYLRERVFQDDNKAMIAALVKNPTVLSRSLDKRIMPRTEALLAAGINPSNHIGMSYITTDSNFQIWFEKKTGSSLPVDWSQSKQAVAKSLQERAKERIDLFSTVLGMTTSDSNNLLEKAPALLSGELDTLTWKLDALLDMYSGSMEDVIKLLLSQPFILVKSLEDNLQPKITYLKENAFAGDEQAFLDAIRKCPAVLGSYSLKNRIKPRIEEVLAAGLDVKDLNLGTMLTYSHHKYSVWLEHRIKEMQATEETQL